MRASQFISSLKDAGTSRFTGVPCSVFKEVIAYLEANEDYMIAASEGEAMGIAAGFSLAGDIPAIFMQNDGLGNAINPLTSLQKLYKLPSLLVISWRGEPGKKDAPQHLWSGKTLTDLLEVLDIKYAILEDDPAQSEKDIQELLGHIRDTRDTGALICRKGLFDKEPGPEAEHSSLLSREQALTTLMDTIQDEALLFSTTGKPSREIYKIRDRDNNFYVVGSMGCTSSIALGARHARRKPTVVVDGDGAVLMKMGTLATIGYYQPQAFLHICVDNQQYESTGGQTTASSTINLAEIAKACRYNRVASVTDSAAIKSFIEEWQEKQDLAFLHIRVSTQTDPALGRPTQSPEEMKKRFMEYMQ